MCLYMYVNKGCLITLWCIAVELLLVCFYCIYGVHTYSTGMHVLVRNTCKEYSSGYEFNCPQSLHSVVSSKVNTESR